MNEPIKVVESITPTLNEALLGIISSATQAKDFILSQVPDVIHQLLVWKMWMSIIECVAGVLLLLIFIVFNILWTKKALSTPSWKYEPWQIANALSLSLLLFAGCLINLTWLQIIIAPKIYLIEYAAKLIK